MVRAIIVTTILFSGAVYAGDVSFRPEVSLEGEYSDNVIVSPDNQAIGDFSTRLRVLLPVINRWDSGRLRLSYEPSVERYQDVDQLDNDAHSLLFRVDDAMNRQSEFHMDLGFVRSLDQGMSSSILGEDLFLVRPSERDRLSGAISYARQVSRRWGWNGGLDGADLKYEELDGDDIPGETIEDRKEYGATLGLDFHLSTQSTFGVFLRQRSNELESSGSEDLQQLGLVWNRTVGRGSDFRLELGVSDRSGEFIMLGQTIPDFVSETEIFGGIELTRSMRKSRLHLLATRQPTSGGTSSSTSTDSLVSIGLSGVPGRSWRWTVTARYASRDPLDSSLEVADTFGAGGQVEWRPTQFSGYRIGFDMVDQSSSGAADRSLGRAWAGVVWYPRGPEDDE